LISNMLCCTHNFTWQILTFFQMHPLQWRVM
jgi:hypothetical protein